MPDTAAPPSTQSASPENGSVFDRPELPGRPHEQVVFCHDPESGLRAIIALWSTALGPGLGGTRFHPYATEAEALSDVLALSKAMAYKAAISGLDLGGGKAVIIGDPATDKSEPLLRAFGRFVQSLAGRYWTACDVGTYVADMDVIARECRYVTGRSPENGGAGDSSVLTAFGVYEAMRATAQHRWGTASLAGRRVGVEGVGKVGHHLVGHLLADGAQVVAADIGAAAADRLRAAYPGVELVEPDVLPTLALDVYSPCALGGAINADSLAALQADVVCGAANNQLASPEMDQALMDAGILYAPDYLVNAGGLIQVADERHGYSEPRARRRASEIHATTAGVLAEAARTGRPTGATADAVAERRMAQVGRLRGIHLPA